jgi:hypothetical protein
MCNRVINLSDHLNITALPVVPENIKQKTIISNYNNESSATWYFLHYLKNTLCQETYKTDGLFRSVLTDGKKIHIYSPPKSIPFTDIKDTMYNDHVFEELVEGTMINLFWNDYSNDWDIATKGSLGGKYSFYQDNKKTFRTMFLEAINNQQIEFEDFNKNICYSFVLQHPDNRIVVPFKNTRVVLVALYKINGFEITVLDKRQCLIPNILLPKTLEQYADYKGSSWQDLELYFNQMKLDYRITGTNIYNPATGTRSKLRNPNYEYVRRLKGNSPKIQFQYYSLRQVGKVGEFLKYYKENRSTFAELRNDLHKWTDQVWKNYVRCYVQKEKPLIEFPKKFRAHMFNLHQIYLNDLRELGHYVSRQIVIKYVNSLEPAQLMYSINYDLRHCEKDEKIANIV